MRHQAVVKSALLIVTPNLGTDGVSFSDRHRVTPSPQAVDEGILPVNPHSHLQAAVVVA